MGLQEKSLAAATRVGDNDSDELPEDRIQQLLQEAESRLRATERQMAQTRTEVPTHQVVRKAYVSSLPPPFSTFTADVRAAYRNFETRSHRAPTYKRETVSHKQMLQGCWIANRGT